MRDDLKTGDHVYLRTGGPVMVLQAFDGEGHCYCVWVEQGERKVRRYWRDELLRADQEEDVSNATTE